jgi:regulatory protein
VESYATKKGVRLIRTELRRKGLKEEDVDEAISELGDQSDAALAIAEKYMRGKEPDMKNVQKLYRHLLSKGFTYDDAKSAVDRIKQDEEY